MQSLYNTRFIFVNHYFQSNSKYSKFVNALLRFELNTFILSTCTYEIVDTQRLNDISSGKSASIVKAGHDLLKVQILE